MFPEHATFLEAQALIYAYLGGVQKRTFSEISIFRLRPPGPYTFPEHGSFFFPNMRGVKTGSDVQLSNWDLGTLLGWTSGTNLSCFSLNVNQLSY